MRPVLPPDLDLLARVMLAVPEGQRAGMLDGLIVRADLADRFRKRTGTAHPEHGDGSLLWIALRQRRAAIRPHCDTAYLAALASVAEAILRWRRREK